MHFTTALVAVLVATGVSAAPLTLRPIVPPNNPSSNGKQSYCTSRSECLSIINAVRSQQEGLHPITLPSNWNKLSRSERLFTFMNIERVSRGLNPFTNLVNTYSSEVSTALANNADPVPPSSIDAGWQSIWAGGSSEIPLAAMYEWMYYDGPGGSNLDCTSSDSSGCWGHRDNILNADSDTACVGAGGDGQGSNGYAAIFWKANQAPSKAEVVLSWANEKSKVTGW